MKVLKIVVVTIGLIMGIHILLYSVSYHEINDVSQIESITIIKRSTEFKSVKYSLEEEIKQIEKAIKRINFFPSKIKSHGESPIETIEILYHNGNKRMINFNGIVASISTISIDNKPLKGTVKFYFINPFVFEILMDVFKIR